jgi:hypothetical protein
MPLQELGKWNKIRPELLPELPADGTVVSFKVNNIMITELDGEKRYPMSYVFPTTSSFIDPETNEIIPIGIIESTDDSGLVPRFRKIRFSPQLQAGSYHVVIGSSEFANDEYRYLMLASEREGNDNAVFGANAKYSLVDNKKTATIESKQRRAKYEAINFAMNVKDTELIDTALILGISPDLDIIEIRNQIEAYAESHPKDFLAKVKDEDGMYIALINNAMRLNITYNSGGTIKWVMGDAKIFELTQDNPLLIPEEFVRFVKLEKQGAMIVDKLKELCEKASKKQTAGRPKKSNSAQ